MAVTGDRHEARAMSEIVTGGCQCGAKRYTVAIADNKAYLCHCRMCQRATGGVAAALKQVPRADVRWETEPDRYRSSPIAQRGFCAACGTPLTYKGDASDKLDLTVGSFDDPYRFKPILNSGVESRHAAWRDTGGLRDIRTDAIPNIVAEWTAATGSFPG